MSSEHPKTGNHGRLPHPATEKLQKDGDRSAARSRQKNMDGKKKEALSISSETGEGQTEKSDTQEKSPSSPNFPDTPKKEGVRKERLAELRRHLQAQFSIQDQPEDPSPGSPLMELVEDIVHQGKVEVGGGDVNAVMEGQCPASGFSRNHTSCPDRLCVEITKVLQKEMAGLKEEITASVDSMKKEMVGLLSSLHENLQAYGDHHVLQPSDLSPLEERDENPLDQRKGSLSNGEKLDNNICPEEKLKSQSVPTLHPLPLSSRNPAMLRVMTTVTAKNSFWSSLTRSNSDPVEPLQAKSSTLPPPVPRMVVKKRLPKVAPPPVTRTFSSNGKSNSKTSSRVTMPHAPCQDSKDRPCQPIQASTFGIDPDGPKI